MKQKTNRHINYRYTVFLLINEEKICLTLEKMEMSDGFYLLNTKQSSSTQNLGKSFIIPKEILEKVKANSNDNNNVNLN